MSMTTKSDDQKRPLRLADCCFLLAIVLLSALPYLSGLGFYSDDWSFRSDFGSQSHESAFRIFMDAVKADDNLRIRPVQTAYLVLTIRSFGDHFLPYHLLSTLLLGVVVILLYAILRELRTGRGFALGIAAVYGLLPQYSSDRFWLASQQAILSMLFALLGIYGLLRSTRPEAPRPKFLGIAATCALALSFLSYEVPAGLIVASIGAIGWHRFRESRAIGKKGFAGLWGIAGTVVVLLGVGLVKTAVQTRIVYNHHFFRFLGHVGPMGAHAISQAIQYNLWSYALHAPWVAMRLYGEGALSVAALATAAMVAIATAVYLWRQMDAADIPSRRVCMQLIAAGFLLYFLGIALLIRTLDSDFSKPGENNRVTIAAALGAAFIAVAITGLACSVLTGAVARARTFSVAIGLICGVNCLIVCGISHYWVDAAQKQAEILSSMRADVPPLPKNGVLLLDGFCRYDGPASVFETDWDTTGAVRVMFNDSTLTGDVVSSNATFGDAAIDTTMYGEAEGHYPYGALVYVYNFRRRSLTGLTSKLIADEYLLANNPTRDNGCPMSRDGDGVKDFLRG